MIPGSDLILARVIAMTYGDCAAFPVSCRSRGSLNGTSMPIKKVVLDYLTNILEVVPTGDQRPKHLNKSMSVTGSCKVYTKAYIENKNTIEHTADSFWDIASRTLRFRCSAVSHKSLFLSARTITQMWLTPRQVPYPGMRMQPARAQILSPGNDRDRHC